jgi:hypothetical protein
MTRALERAGYHVDKLGELSMFRAVNGPAGLQLATREDSVPRSLGSASFDVGIITGSRRVASSRPLQPIPRHSEEATC